MTERKSKERRRSDEDEPKVDKETVKDLEPPETDEVRGGGYVRATDGASCAPNCSL